MIKLQQKQQHQQQQQQKQQKELGARFISFPRQQQQQQHNRCDERIPNWRKEEEKKWYRKKNWQKIDGIKMKQ